MSIGFESERECTKSTTYYPFLHPLPISPKFLMSVIIKSSLRVYVKSITQNKIIFYDENESLLGEAIYGALPGIYPISGSKGYVEVGEPLGVSEISFSFMESEILSSCIFDQEYVQTITNNVFKDGYNFEFLLNGNTIKFNIDRGVGKGEFCGNNFDYNAIYTINSVKPINGNLQWFENGFFKIIPGDEGSSTLYFTLSVPDDICLRDGFKGPPGPDGLDGANGKDGLDVTHLVIEFEC